MKTIFYRSIFSVSACKYPLFSSSVRNAAVSPSEPIHLSFRGIGYTYRIVMALRFCWSSQERSDSSSLGGNTIGVSHSVWDGFITSWRIACYQFYALQTFVIPGSTGMPLSQLPSIQPGIARSVVLRYWLGPGGNTQLTWSQATYRYGLPCTRPMLRLSYLCFSIPGLVGTSLLSWRRRGSTVAILCFWLVCEPHSVWVFPVFFCSLFPDLKFKLTLLRRVRSPSSLMYEPPGKKRLSLWGKRGLMVEPLLCFVRRLLACFFALEILVW